MLGERNYCGSHSWRIEFFNRDFAADTRPYGNWINVEQAQ